MTKNIFTLMMVSCALIACRSETRAPVDGDCTECAVTVPECENCIPGHNVKYSSPNGNDLVLETPRRVVHIETQPGKSYDYYVWTGDKSYEDDPDLIIQDGVAAVLVDDEK